MGGHALVYKICTESSQPKDAESQCYTLYLDYCRGICGQFDGKERRTAFTALKGIFKYLDQHFTDTKDRPGMVRSKQPTSKLCAGQDLKTSADAIAADDCWIPDYQAAPVVEAAPVAAEVQAPPVAEEAPAAPAAGLYRAASAPRTLSRATSISTLNNIGDLKAWVATKSDKWVSGETMTPAEVSEGHALVYKICTDSTQPKDAENQCYTLYLDYCRGICGQFQDKERRTALQALKTVFKYLDQHFTCVKDRPGMVRGKQPTSKLCAGQDLKTSALAIAADLEWIPDYQSAAAARAAPAPKPAAPAPAPAAPVQPEPAAPAPKPAANATDTAAAIRRTRGADLDSIRANAPTHTELRLLEEDRHEAGRRQAFLGSLSSRVDARRVQSDHLNRVMADATEYEAQALASVRSAASEAQAAGRRAHDHAASYGAPRYSPYNPAARYGGYGNPSHPNPHFRRY